MKISALTTSLPVPLPQAISKLAEAGFGWIDVPPTAAARDIRRLISDLGLHLGCVGLEREMPGAFDLASESEADRQAAVDYFRGALDATAEMSVCAGYITPPQATDETTRGLWNDSLQQLAEHALECSVDLCIEHFPTRLLHSGQETLEWLEQMGVPSLKLLIDVGHCLISREDPAELIRAAGSQLGYIHFDDNDGEGDLHWPLLTGVCTEEVLRSTLSALVDCGYDRTLCLELNPELDSPLKNLTSGNELLAKLMS
jgi:sugar phosphate isomerase/epimerase